MEGAAWDVLKASVRAMLANSSGNSGYQAGQSFAFQLVLDEMETIELARVQAMRPDVCGCDRKHPAGAVMCFICDRPLPPANPVLHWPPTESEFAHVEAIQAAQAGACSHGGHGWDGDTCDDIPAPSDA